MLEDNGFSTILQTLECRGMSLLLLDGRSELSQVMFPVNMNKCKLKIKKYFPEIVVDQHLPYHVSNHKGTETTHRSVFSLTAPRNITSES